MLIIWTTVLLLSMTSLGDACVLGMVGESAVLPCVYNGTLDLGGGNVSVEWRTGSDLVHRSVLGTKGEVIQFASSRNRTQVATDATQIGDVSLLISDVTVRDARSYDCYLTHPGVQSDIPLCTVCLSAAAHFTPPVVLRGDEALGEEAHFTCHSRGGFPEPEVHWFIDGKGHPLVGTVRTYSDTLPETELYNITSILSVNLTQDITVSCAVENSLLNETLTSTNVGVSASPVAGRASEAMWMFSTGLCVVVGIMVVAAVVLQIKHDYEHKKNCREIGDKDGSTDDESQEMLERMDCLTETTI